MFTYKRENVALALAAMVLCMIATVITGPINATEDAPLSTRAAVAVPAEFHSTPEPIPDGRRNFRMPATPSQIVVSKPELPKPVKASVPPKSKPQRIKQTPVAPPATPAPTSSSVEIAVQFALAQRGKPYIWGATGPRGFDCSGLVVTAFGKAGIKLPRTTKTIIGKGKPVSRNALQRGDLVWTSSGHMGIYVGEGKMVHAPQSGDVVKVSPLWAFYAARRL